MTPLLLASLLLVAPVSADQLIASAQKRAASSGKNVLVRFTASWCPWCRRFDRLIANPTFAKQFADSYEIVPITVRERGELQANENPGWPAVMLRLRGAKEQDVPYLAVLSPGGEKLADSYRVTEKEIPSNAGFPRSEVEIEAFIQTIRKTAKGFTAADRIALKQYFVAEAAKK